MRFKYIKTTTIKVVKNMNTGIICNNKKDIEIFNNRIKGHVIISAEGFISSIMAISLSEVTITENALYDKICDYAFNNGLYYQSLFQDDQYGYMSCFIYDVSDFRKAFEGEELLNPLFEIKNNQNLETDHFLISFPDEKIN